MKKVESIVRDHYSVNDLGKNILNGLTETGKDTDRLTVDDLSVVDEFHIGGRQATEHLISKLALSGHEHVLDIGSGIGGAARTIATHTGCRVSGIDLTPEYVDVAQMLSRLTGHAETTNFQAASALSIPFDNQTFDAAITLHVAMNIEDRDTLYKEIARVLKSGAKLCIYDVMKKNDDPIAFPVPWAAIPEASHLRTPEHMSTHLEDAGFEVIEIEDRTEFANEYFERRMAASTGTPSPLGPHLVMGKTAKEKINNIRHNVESGRVAPVQMIAVRK